MFKLTPVLFLVSCTTSDLHLKPGGYSLFEQPRKFNIISKVLEKADHNFTYDYKGELNPSLKSLPRGTCQRFATVRFDKNAPWFKSREEVIPEIERQFFTLGFNRIVFTGAHSSCIIVIKDSRKPFADLAYSPSRQREQKANR